VSDSEEKQHSLNPSEIDLARLAAQHGHQDGYLLDLIRLADGNLSLPVGLLLNGMVLVGSLAPPEEMAKEIDAERSRLAQQFRKVARPEGFSEEDWEKALDQFEAATSNALRRFREQEEKFEDELDEIAEGRELEIEALPATLARRMIDIQAREFLTLKNVQIAAPAQMGLMRLDVLRVAVSRIDAWWPVRLDEEGKATFKVFSPEATEPS
jgi:hypothetical protein